MQKPTFTISGNLVDIPGREIYPVSLHIENGKIIEIVREQNKYAQYIMPGFIDAHIHIESSMLVPSTFAGEAIKHGTIATVSDPHEIANVLGMEGVRFMIENGKKVPFYFYFGAPSCVPATPFESSGSVLDADDVEELLQNDEIVYLAEMMNFPGVLNDDKDVWAKIQSALSKNKVIDGHAPGLTGKEAEKYFGAGISTDHECFTLEEALEKASLGVHILIREGSAAKNFETLLPLLKSHPKQVMFCSDDKHPDELLQGHINQLAKSAIDKGYDMFDTLAACTLNPAKHYKTTTGRLQKGDSADFIVVDSPCLLNVHQTYIKGEKVYNNGEVFFPEVKESPVNRFEAQKISPAGIKVSATSVRVRVIHAIDNEIVTEELTASLPVVNGELQNNTAQDILKLVIVNRYKPSPPAVGFIHNFGLKAGAIASTVAHDSHNIIAVGADDESICRAINHLIDIKGGICVVGVNDVISLPLPVAGLMSLEPAVLVAQKYRELDKRAKSLGCRLKAPFMTLSFMSLLVIPKLKLSDKGLFDAVQFQFTSIYA